MRIFLVFLVAGCLSATTVFTVSETNAFTSSASSFPLRPTPSVVATPLPAANGITGFKISGEAAASNSGIGTCTSCQLQIQAQGRISSQNAPFGTTPSVPVNWSFRVDEYTVAPAISDGTSNTISLITVLPPTRNRFADGTSNTIFFPEPDFRYRLVWMYQTNPGGIQDGTSNTIVIGEAGPQTIASGNGLFGDVIEGAGLFDLQRFQGDFTLALIVDRLSLAANHGIKVVIPTNSIDVNPPATVPEPRGVLLCVAGLAGLHFLRALKR